MRMRNDMAAHTFGTWLQGAQKASAVCVAYASATGAPATQIRQTTNMTL